MLELGLYEQFKGVLMSTSPRRTGTTPVPSMDAWQEVLAAAATGGVTALATTPIDVIKTKLMVDHYDGFFDCLLLTVSHHGIPALFAGVYARIGWIVPFTAIYLPTYDFLKRRLGLLHKDFVDQQSERMR